MKQINIAGFLGIWLLAIPAFSDSRLKIQLELFFNFEPQDSIVQLTRTDRDSLKLKLNNPFFKKEREQTAFIPGSAINALRLVAEEEGIPWKTSVQKKDAPPLIKPEVAETPLPDLPVVVDSTGPTPSELKRNKLWYVLYQTGFSTYNYGFALPLALDLGPEKAAASGLLAIPSSFALHYYINRNRNIHKSHFLATRYFSTNALAMSYMTSFLILGDGSDSDRNSSGSGVSLPFRAGSFAAMITYPFALKYGFKHGDRFLKEPGRVNLQSSFAYTSAYMSLMAMGYWVDLLDEDNEDAFLRIMMGQTMAAGVAGHYLSSKYRTHERIPGGTGMGISTFAVFGFGVGFGTLISAEIESNAGISSILLASTGAGFASGMYFFRDKYDTFNRSFYNSLGAVAGAVTPFGIMGFIDTEPNDKALVWMATGGGIAGYALTRWATRKLVEAPHKKQKNHAQKISLNLIPLPTPMTSPNPETGKSKVHMGYRVPGLLWKF